MRGIAVAILAVVCFVVPGISLAQSSDVKPAEAAVYVDSGPAHTGHTGHTDSIDEILRRLDKTELLLEQTTNELNALKSNSPEPQAESDGVQQASYCEERGAAGCTHCAPGSSGHSGHGFMADMHDDYRSRWSWHKGKWRIVPFGALRGEIIYTPSETTVDAAIFHVSPAQPGINDERATVTGPDDGPGV